MSTKSKKSSSQHSTNEVSSSDRPGSPLSQARLTRIDEKNELQNLNDRLANYIEQVRRLEQDNARLNQQIQTSQEIVTREVVSIKSLYEKELSDARSLVDETSKERAKLQIDVNRYKNENEDLIQKLNKREKELAAATKKISHLEANLDDLKVRNNQAVVDKKRAEEDLKEALNEADTLNKQLDALRKQLQEETLRRVDLENRNQSLREDLQFKEQVYQVELNETKTIHETQITDAVHDQIRQTEEKFEDQLRQLREESENQLRLNREDIEAKYQAQLNELQRALDERARSSTANRGELQSLKTKYEQLLSKNSQYEAVNQSLKSRIKDLERIIEQEREWNANAIAEKDDQINQLREEIKNMTNEYADLLDIKVALDMEINAYRKLLEGEESRLNLSGISSSPSSPALATRVSSPRGGTPRGAKRKRTVLLQEEENIVDIVVNSNAKGDVEVNDHDQDGKFVKLFNKGDKEVSLSGWQIMRKAGDQETRFKFHRSMVIKPNTSVTVWSSDCNEAHNPPSDVVMKGQKWFVSEEMSTTLLNNSGEEVAVRETTKKLRSTLAQRTSGGFLRATETSTQERCSIM